MLPARPHLRQHPQQASSQHLGFAAADVLPSCDDRNSSPRTSKHYRPIRFATQCGVVGALFLVSSVAWWIALSSSSSSSSPSFATRNLAADNPQPWVGPQGLVAPSVSNNTDIHHHVRIIIRVHHEHKNLVRGLIHNFRFQQRLLSKAPDEPTMSMSFALVPTELPGVAVTQDIARHFWLNPSDPFPHVYALDLDEDFFVAAAEKAAPFKCTKAQMKELGHEMGKASMKKICRYDNHVYYQATDVALKEVMECAWCTHVLVTNDDNGYHPDYFKETLMELDPPPREGEAPQPKPKKKKKKKSVKKNSSSSSSNVNKEKEVNLREKEVNLKKEKRALLAVQEEVEEKGRRGWDLVTTDFTTSGIFLPAEWKLGSLDLGSILLSKEIVGKLGGFIEALPRGSGPEDAHNADWLFTKKALAMGATAKVVNRLLFFHN